MESQAQKESQGQDGPLQGITIQSVLGLCQVLSGTLLGLELQPIQVEVSSRRGPAMFQMAGLADASVREARVRVASALGRRGLTLDEYALTVNLAPANLRKVGSGLDMAIALAILGATGSCPAHELSQPLFVGELGLDGSVRPVPGVLPLLEGAKLQGVTRAFVPADNAREASFVQDIEVYPVPHIDALVDHFQSNHRRDRLVPIKQARFRPVEFNGADLADIRGQGAAKRALVIAAAGEHNLLLLGPPGSGKTLLARRLPGLLPSLTAKQALETTAIHSIAGTVDPKRGIVDTRPFRAPHHTVSEPGLIGGGSIPRPGEISLAHHGVLFLDELPEFRRGVLESLRQPLEEHAVHIVRARTQATFPARPLVVAAMNPCPYGFRLRQRSGDVTLLG